jgi:4'-phosphopantetheinyl transferase
VHISFYEWEDSARERSAAAALGSDQVQVWTAAVPDDKELTALNRMLSASERERAERFLVPEPRRQFVFGRALLRQLLGACLTIDPATVAFGSGPRGKPFLEQSASDGDLRFNLSHSGSLVAVGLARGHEVGVDLEWMHHLAEWSPLAARIFSARELDELYALPEPQQREAFFNGWTRKEAYLKATGEGLTDTLPAIEVALAPGQEPRLLRLSGDADAARQWTMRAIPLPRGFAGTVAFETCPSQPLWLPCPQ